jgi:chemotaxis methyl-accepting protein methylase
MLRRGIYCLSQLEGQAPLRDIYGQRKPISITLYDSIRNLENHEELAEEILTWFSNDRGAFKRTRSQRFEEFDRSVNEIMARELSRDAPIKVHDLGISTGETAYDYYHKLSALFPQLEYWASDYEAEIQVVESGKYRLTLSASGKPLEFVASPFVFSLMRPESWKRYPINALIRNYYQATAIKSLYRQFQEHPAAARRIMLFSPLVLDLSRNHPKFHLLTYNVLDPSPIQTPLNIVRAMNILNRSYFSDSEMRTVLLNIHSALDFRGYLISGSNHEANSPVDGAVYQKHEFGFSSVESYGRGHQWHDVIANWSTNR